MLAVSAPSPHSLPPQRKSCLRLWVCHASTTESWTVLIAERQSTDGISCAIMSCTEFIIYTCQHLRDIGRRSLRSADVLTCATIRTWTRLGDRSFSVAGPCLWNSLPVALNLVYTMQPVVQPVVQYNRLHRVNTRAAGCTTGCTAGCTTGYIVYTQLYVTDILLARFKRLLKTLWFV